MVATKNFLTSLLVLLSSLSTTIASPPSPEYPPTCPQISPNPIPLQQVPSHFLPRAVIDVSATETIKRTLAIYALAVDGKDWAALDAVFAADAVANYSAPLGVLEGLSAIQSTLSASLAQFPGGTQHSLGTQIVDVCAQDVAVSVTYYTATHYLGAARDAASIVNGSQVLYAHGQYQDTWGKDQDGGWKIAYRNLVYMRVESKANVVVISKPPFVVSKAIGE
ncbi:hypothetical protein SLS58_000596 [Diplodia intermedia]|uniref:SnoaL-like domain-containing protein n=1 Tax=Diplodia intermedia TaxID=856260 RepID=A0ABR3U523_9PEZI